MSFSHIHIPVSSLDVSLDVSLDGLLLLDNLLPPTWHLTSCLILSLHVS